MFIVLLWIGVQGKELGKGKNILQQAKTLWVVVVVVVVVNNILLYGLACTGQSEEIVFLLAVGLSIKLYRTGRERKKGGCT